MTDALVVLCTCGGDEEARRISGALVEARLAACVNILPGVQSVYRWQGEIETAAETLLFIKTTSDRFAALRDRIRELHSYDTPEIVALPVTVGSEDYLAWLRGQV